MASSLSCSNYYDDFSDDSDEEGPTTWEEEEESDAEETEEDYTDEEDEDVFIAVDDDEDFEYEAGPANHKKRRKASEFSLVKSLSSGKYPVFYGKEGPSERMDPRQHSALDYVQKLWPLDLCVLIAQQTNKYALQRGTAQEKGSRGPTTAGEIWSFLGMVVLMSVRPRPRLTNYWSTDPLLGDEAIAKFMPRDRFLFLFRHLHLVDETSLSSEAKQQDRHYKVRPLLRILQRAFMLSYSPSQEFVVDELMIKSKGRAKGRVYMPKKPIKRGFKLWGLSCSCCGYLCNFQLYAGKCTKEAEKGLAKRVVLDLVEPYGGVHHVVYLDNFFTSLDLALRLIDMRIGIVGTAKSNCQGFPDGLRGNVDLEKGNYLCVPVAQGKINCYAYHDRNMVRFITNVFPAHMASQVPVRQSSGVLVAKHVPPLLPAYNKFMGAVDLTGQLRKYYGFDRKCKRPWLRIFFNMFDLAIDNAHILYKHNCRGSQVKPNDLLGFRLELVHCLLDDVSTRSRKRTAPQALHVVADPLPESCRLVHVNDVAGMKRGRCSHCLKTKEKPDQKTTRFCCGHCKVLVCKTGCYDVHRGRRLQQQQQQ